SPCGPTARCSRSRSSATGKSSRKDRARPRSFADSRLAGQLGELRSISVARWLNAALSCAKSLSTAPVRASMASTKACRSHSASPSSSACRKRFNELRTSSYGIESFLKPTPFACLKHRPPVLGPVCKQSIVADYRGQPATDHVASIVMERETIFDGRVRLEKVCKAYGSTIVLNNVNFSAKRGEFVVIMGRSGSGKSTLLRLLGGLETPDAGSVEHGGVRLERMTEAERARFRRREIGFVFQFFNLIPTLTVAENIRLPLAL